MIAVRLQTPEKIRDLQRKLYLKAKKEPKFRFYLLQDKVWREDILQHAYRLVRANGGAPGIDGVTFQSIETGEGEAKFVSTLQQELKEKSYRAQAGAAGVHSEGRWKEKAVRDTDDPRPSGADGGEDSSSSRSLKRTSRIVVLAFARKETLIKQ